MSSICSVGHLALDYILGLPKFSEHESEVVDLNYFTREYGGVAGNMAVISRHLGLNASVCSYIGKDLYGLMYLRYLKELDIDVSQVRIVDEETPKAVFLINESENVKKQYFYEGVSPVINMPSSEWLNKHDLVYLATKHVVDTLNFLRIIDKSKTLTAVDPWLYVNHVTSQELREILSKTDVLFVRNELQDKILKLAGMKSIEELQNLGVSIIVKTMGKEGSITYYKQGLKGKQLYTPALTEIAVKKVYPSGAGDGYRSGFLTALLKGFSIEEASQIGAVVATFVLQQPGIQTRIPTWKQVLEFYKEIKKSGIL